MRTTHAGLVWAAAACLCLAALPGSVGAEDFPTRPIKLVVPFPPGGVTDIAARLFGGALGQELGQPVVVENRSGASGRIGTESAARSPADGYALAFGNSVTHGSLVTSKNLPYDPQADFTPIVPLFWYAAVLICNPTVPARTLTELIAYAGSKPDGLSFGNPGIGTAGHFMSEYLAQTANIRLIHVPYRGSAPLLQDIIGKRIDCAFDGQARQQVESGAVRAIATTGAERDSQYPNIPTMREAGLKDYELVIWQALFAPAGLPNKARDRLVAAAQASLQMLVEQKKLAPLGLNPLPGNASTLKNLVAAEISKYRRIAGKLSIELE